MSDNPDEPIIQNVGVETDEASFENVVQYINRIGQSVENVTQDITEWAQAQEGLTSAENATLDALMAELEYLGQINGQANEFIQASEASAAAVTNETDAINALAEAFREENTRQEVQDMLALADAEKQATEQSQALQAQWDETFAANERNAAGYGQQGGNIGPAEDTGDGGGSGGGGSPIGLARGLSFAGRATGARGLTEAGGLIYVEEALKQIAPLAEKAGTALQGMGGLVGGIAEAGATAGPALLGMSASIGAITAVAAAFAIPIAVGIAAWESLQNTLKDADAALIEAEASVAEYYKAIAKGTTDTLSTQLSDAQEQRDLIDAQIRTNGQALQNGFAGAQQQFGDFGARLTTGLQGLGLFGGGIKDVTDQTDKLTKQSNDLTAQIDGLGRAMDSAAVIANNLIAQDDAEVAAKLKYFQMQGQSVANLEKTLEQQNFELDLNATEQQKLTDQLSAGAITNDAYQLKMAALQKQQDELTASTTVLTNNLIPAAQATQALADAQKAATKATDDYKKSLQAVTDEQTAEADATTKYTDAKAKALQDQIANEAQINADNSAKRTQEVADFNATQAANVAAFHQKQDDETTTFHQKQADEVTAFNQSIADIQTKANDQRAKDEAAYQAASRQAEIDLANKIAQIRTDLGANELQDAAHLDARKLESDKEAAAKKINDAQTTFDNEKAKRDDAENQKLADLNNQVVKETEQRTTAFDQKQAQEQTQEGQKQAQEQKNFEDSQRKADQQFKDKLAKEDEQEAVATAKRQDQYAKQNTAIDANYATQIQNLRDNLADKLKVQIDGQNSQLKSATDFVKQMSDAITAGYQTALNNIAHTPGPAYSPTAAENTPVASSPTFAGGSGGTIYGGNNSGWSGGTGGTVTPGQTGFIGPIEPNAGSNYTPVHGPFAGGLENVPYSNFLAQLDEGERVLPADANQSLEKIVTLLSGSGGNTTNNHGGNVYNLNMQEMGKSAFKNKLAEILQELG